MSDRNRRSIFWLRFWHSCEEIVLWDNKTAFRWMLKRVFQARSARFSILTDSVCEKRTPIDGLPLLSRNRSLTVQEPSSRLPRWNRSVSEPIEENQVPSRWRRRVLPQDSDEDSQDDSFERISLRDFDRSFRESTDGNEFPLGADPNCSVPAEGSCLYYHRYQVREKIKQSRWTKNYNNRERGEKRRWKAKFPTFAGCISRYWRTTTR